MRLLFLLFVFPSVLVTLGACGENSPDAITIEEPWIREAPPNASAMAGYMRIVNNTDQDNTLVAATSNDFKVIEFHRSIEKDGVYKMVPYEKLLIPARQALELKPGDYHLMMIVPQRTLKSGDNVSVELSFADDSKAVLEMPVKKAVFN